MQQKNQSDRRDGTAQVFGALVRAKRLALRLSQAELAAELGVTRSYVTRLESVRRHPHPSLAIVAAVSERLGIPSEDVHALTGYTLPTNLPSFGTYLKAKHPDWPDEACAVLIKFYEFVRREYSLN